MSQKSLFYCKISFETRDGLWPFFSESAGWGESDRLRLAIVLDEAHRLSGDTTLPKIMKEGRKFGVVVIVARQGLKDYHPEVLANVGTKVVFRTNHPMSRKAAGFLQPARNHNLVQAIE